MREEKTRKEELEKIDKLLKISKEVHEKLGILAMEFADALVNGEEPDPCDLIFTLRYLYREIVGKENEILKKFDKACVYVKNGYTVTVEPP